MALEIRQHDSKDDEEFGIAKFDGKWAVSGMYYWNWIWGFDTKEDAKLVFDALETSAESALDLATSS